MSGWNILPRLFLIIFLAKEGDLMSIEDMITYAIEAAYLAGNVLLKKYLRVHDIKEKSDVTDLVTEADKEAESVVRNYLNEVLNGTDFSIVGEEEGGNTRGRYVWYVDPLDGTANFAKGIPIYAVSIGVLDNGKFYIGAIYHPTENMLYWGSVNTGTWLNGRRVYPQYEVEVSKAYVGLGFPRRCTEEAQNASLLFQDYSALNARKFRSIGSAALGLAWVASGFLDMYFQPCLSMWDMAAGIALVLATGRYVYIDRVDDTTFGVLAAGNEKLYEKYIRYIPYLQRYKPVEQLTS